MRQNAKYRQYRMSSVKCVYYSEIFWVCIPKSTLVEIKFSSKLFWARSIIRNTHTSCICILVLFLTQNYQIVSAFTMPFLFLDFNKIILSNELNSKQYLHGFSKQLLHGFISEFCLTFHLNRGLHFTLSLYSYIFQFKYSWNFLFSFVYHLYLSFSLYSNDFNENWNICSDFAWLNINTKDKHCHKRRTYM